MRDPSEVDKQKKAHEAFEKDLKLADDAFTDPGFWATLQVLEGLQSVLTSMESWASGCPCHGNMLEQDRKGRWHRTKGYQKMAGLSDPFEFCPYCGCRAPEIAAGKLVSHTQEVADMVSTEVMLHAFNGVDESMREELTRQWHLGCGVIIVGMNEKLAFWSELPHALVGLASFDDSVVRATARSCLAKFPYVASSLHHPLSRLFLDPAHEVGFHSETKAVADGASISAQSEAFKLWVFRMRFWTLLETPIEEKHARLSRMMRKDSRVSESTYSTRLRIGEIVRHIEEDPQFLKALLKEFDELHSRGRLFMLEQLGLHLHPSVLAKLADRRNRKDTSVRTIENKLAKHIVCHADPESQYQTHAEATVECARKKAQREKLFKDLVAQSVRDHKWSHFEAPNLRVRAADTAETLLEKLQAPLIIKHAQSRLSIGDVCSIPAPDMHASHTCLEVGEALGMQQTSGAIAWSSWQVMSDLGSEPDEPMQGKQRFFTVLQLTPSTKKVVQRKTFVYSKIKHKKLSFIQKNKKPKTEGCSVDSSAWQSAKVSHCHCSTGDTEVCQRRVSGIQGDLSSIRLHGSSSHPAPGRIASSDTPSRVSQVGCRWQNQVFHR